MFSAMHENPNPIMPVFYQHIAQQLLAKAEMIGGITKGCQ